MSVRKSLVRKRPKDAFSLSAAAGAVSRQDVEADVFEIWMVASRLLGRLAEPSRPLNRRGARPRGRTAGAGKTVATRSALIP